MAISTEPARVMERPAQQTSAAVAKLAGGGTALLAASVAGNALSYGFGIFLARFLGMEQFGLYALGLTFFNLLALFTPLALDVGLLKFVSTDRAEGKITICAALSFMQASLQSAPVCWRASA